MSVGLSAQDRPLPDLQPFLAQARTRLQTDNERQRSYIYVETQRERKLDGKGGVRSESVKVVESYPPLPGEDERWERVLEEDGKRKTAAELARQDAERQKTAEAVAKRLSSQAPGDRAKATRDYEKSRKEALDRINDLFIVYDIKMAGRERLDGHDTIALTLDPRPNARPATREGKWMRYFRCRAWISETDHELVKLDVEAIRDANIGFGLLARMNKGTVMTFTRRFVNNEVWLPARADYTIKARVLMLKRFLQGGTIEFSNYRKFTVDTATTIATPADN
ncbi:MAG TPA: hypothetical protein VFO31_05655 [Vicinamibacterales bacterium]|nr:hypothetical protein [Vicinamibacterales bacterium]